MVIVWKIPHYADHSSISLLADKRLIINK